MDYDSVEDLTWKLLDSNPNPTKLQKDITRTAKILHTLVKRYTENVYCETVPTECPQCKSKNFHPVEIDIGEVREYRCSDCNFDFWGKNPSYQGDSL